MDAIAKLRVLIVDDDLFVRVSLADYLSTAPDITLAGACRDGAEAVEVATRTPTPDVVLMDIQMPVMDGVESTRLIVERAPACKVVALTSLGDDESVARMLAAGALGYVLKNTRPGALVDAVRAAHQGLMIVPSETVGRWAARGVPQTGPTLTERERQVLDLLADGLNNREIGQAMFLSRSTIKNQVSALMVKFGVRSRTHMVARAHELGLLSRP